MCRVNTSLKYKQHNICVRYRKLLSSKGMSYTDQMEISEMDEIINDSFCNDESSNDFNGSLQVTTMASIGSHAQNSGKSIPLHKTRSGLKYNTTNDSLTLKRVSSSASCSFTGNESPSPSKVLNTDHMAVLVHSDLITSLEDVTQYVEDDEDDAMEYDAEDQNESAVSSPQTSTNKYKLNASSSIDNKCDGSVKCPDYTIDDNSLISSTLSTIIDPNTTEFHSFNVNVEQTVVHRQTRQRIKRGLKSVSRKMLKPSKLLFADKLSTKVEKEESIFLMPRYPLRSRARLEKVKTRLRESVVSSKNLDTLPVEIYYKIFQYLPIQDLFRIQRINKRFKDAVDNHLVMVKRINFSCGLPFAFLPDCLNDSVLKRILSKTPEVTHILGFYPRKIEDVPGIDNSLTYGGIMSALRQCSKLRSVEIMDLELMSRVVHAMGRVKFHGMFRNRPYSWEDEFANPLLNKPANSISAIQNATNTTSTLIPPITAGSLPLFENNTEQRQAAAKYGICNKLSSSLCNWVGLQQINNKDLYMNFINYSWLSFLEQMSYTATGQGLPLLQPINQGPFVNLVTPIPPSIDKLIIPTTINNLTKLDLVSVCIQHLPRLENIKYLHLKWVRFSSPDPFMNFQAPKIQSFVMNNCIGPIRGMRYVRIFTALARSTQLNRLELVSTRIVESLFENFFFDNDQGHRCFRNLQRLVLASNKEFGEVDVATLLLSSHASLNHLALSVSHSRNSLMLSLVNAQVVMQKLESVILGYQDPFQSMLTGVEIHNLGLHDSPDHSLPICKITDRGLAALMKLAPKLVSLHLRHAIYVEDPMLWLSNNWPYPIGKRPINPYADNNEEPEDQLQNNFFLKSLTLENCPGIRPESISFILNHPASGFPQLEMLVLRDMFPPLPKCALPQAEIDYSLFNNCFHRDDRKQSFSSCCPPKVLSCRGKLVNYSVVNKKDSRIKTQLMDGLSDRFCSLPQITSPGGCSSSNNQTQESFTLNHNSHNNPSINVGDIIDNPANPAANRFSRIFISNLTPNEIRPNNNNDSGMFGMGSTGLALHNAAGAQVLGAQHTNLGASIRQNEILRPQMIVNAMKNITMLHRLENLGLGKTALWDNYRLSSFGKNHHGQPCANNVSDMSSKISKRKRSRSNEQFNQMIHGLYFHNSLVPKSKFSKPSKKDQNKQEKSTKKRKINDQAWVDSTKTEDHIFDFQSTGTQTCVCGHIDWLDSLWQRDIALFDDLNSQWHAAPTMRNKQSDTVHNITTNSPHKSPNNKSNACTNTATARQTSYINISEYGCRLCSLPVDNDSNPSTISATQPELYLEHRPREWQAQNAAVDTMSLRLYLKQQLYFLDLKQNSFAHLTTLHLEKVGITHLVLSSCHRLKSITLENCPELQAIVINTGTAPPSDSMPNLRRIRIMRCPKFAIYNLLYNITRFYPQHDDNLYITYRPFGEYNPLVEKALWINSESQHVMVSHEYRQASSERNLEELCSSFDQLFREMLNFSERDILTVSDFSRVNYFTNGSFLRSEHGTDWDLLTDIPWISEVCCSMLPSDLTRTQQADQLYELLSEIQSHLGHMKLRRRGIHFHVQFRDVHKPWMIDSSSLINDIIADNTPYSYLPCAYTDRYLESTHPRDDTNANYCEPNLHEMYPDLCSANNVAHNYEEEEDEEQSEFIAELYRMSHSNHEHNTNSSSSNHSNQSSNSSGSSSNSNSNMHNTIMGMLPPHLRDLLNDHMTLSPDINERVPIPQQHSTNLTTNTNPVNSSKPASLRGAGRLATDSAADNNHSAHLSDTAAPPPPPPPPSSATSSTSAEYMANKIYKFRATITALKKSSNDSSSSSSLSLPPAPVATIPDCAHSTRSRTAEMTQNNNNNNNRY